MARRRKSEVFALDTLLAARAAAKTPYFEFLRVRDLSAGLYVLAAGSVDRQTPHTEDELYLLLSGRAQLRVGQVSTPVGAGSLLYVRAGQAHAFHSIVEGLKALVIFGPAERKRRWRPVTAR